MSGPARTITDVRQFDSEVRLEQVQHLYRQLLRSTAAMMIAGGIMVFAMWGQISSAWLLTWLGAIALNQLWRYTLYRKFATHSPKPHEARYWANYWTIGAGISGIIWGSTALFMFVPGSPGHQAFLAAALIGVTAGALALITIHAWSFYAFVTPTLVPITLRLLYEGDRLHLSLAATCLMVFIAALIFGGDLNRKLADSIRLRLQKSQFLARTAHDIRSETQILQMNADTFTALASTADDGAVMRQFDSVVSSLAEMAEQLSEFAEIESGKLQPMLSTISLQELFDRLRSEFKPVATARDLKFVILETDAMVRSDRRLLQRMLWNLVANAIRHTALGGVLVCTRRRGEVVRIEVYDTGPGIAEEDRERIFHEFERLPRTKGLGYRGMGLGLAIVRGFAQLLGHQVDLTSRVGRGSRFSISVPTALERAESATTDEQPSRRYDLAGRCVVVIDDEPGVLEAIGGKLRDWGCDVVVAATANEAVEALGARMPQLVIADYALENNKTGIEAIDHIRQQMRTRVPAFLITGAARSEVEAQAASRQLRVVSKPITPARLRSVVTGVLNEGPSAV